MLSSPPANPTATQWTQQPERSQRPVVRFMVWLSLLVGRSASRLLLRLIALYFLVFSPKVRGALQAFYRHLWRRPAGWRQLYRHFLAFSTVIHDRIFLLNGETQLFDIALQGDAADVIARLRQQAQGVVVLGGHFGSFEVLRAHGQQSGHTVHMMMYSENADKLNAILAAINPHVQHHIIALNQVDSMLQAREKLAQGHWLGLLADRTFANDETVTLPFLGGQATFPTGPLRLAAMLGCPAVFLAGCHVQGNRYDVHATLLADFRDCPREARAQRLADAQRSYVAQLEALCHHYPHNWFNFFDFWQTPSDGV